MRKGIWEDEEVKALFKEVELSKQSKQSIRQAFVMHAQKFGRKPNSVRNYYYHEVDNLKSDPRRSSKLSINLSNHEKTTIKYFSKEEESGLMKRIDDLVKSGYSVRRACLTLSQGDVNTMLRYQNKYRSYIGSSTSGKVIKFAQHKKEVLTEADINSLFMGLVRLVKRSAVDELANKMKQERDASNYLLRKTLVDLNHKEREIMALKEEFAHLKSENAKLVQSMIELKCDKATKLSKHLKEKGAL